MPASAPEHSARAEEELQEHGGQEHKRQTTTHRSHPLTHYAVLQVRCRSQCRSARSNKAPGALGATAGDGYWAFLDSLPFLPLELAEGRWGSRGLPIISSDLRQHRVIGWRRRGWKLGRFVGHALAGIPVCYAYQEPWNATRRHENPTGQTDRRVPESFYVFEAGWPGGHESSEVRIRLLTLHSRNGLARTHRLTGSLCERYWRHWGRRRSPSEEARALGPTAGLCVVEGTWGLEGTGLAGRKESWGCRRNRE